MKDITKQDVLNLILKSELENKLICLTKVINADFKIYTEEELDKLIIIINNGNNFKLIDYYSSCIKISFFDKNNNKMLLEL